ncbi:hypothetical protein DICVIV_04181 [Dictyocaulus viviparus]|uniref:Uncharacterized protein n=1 Tax=Dictyocaulus viviparus TaxID=29172 RepID=A0A0D8Y0Z3_DICVI|nr:hypothetical protein DICVIV_04181 [Dictyocaulus viviparus]
MAEKEYRKLHGLHDSDDYKGRFENIMGCPREALMRMIIMSVGEFGAVYRNLNDCKSSVALQGKWAQVILMLEQSLTNAERLMVMYSYSRPVRSDKARRAFVVRQKSDVGPLAKEVTSKRTQNAYYILEKVGNFKKNRILPEKT